MHKYLILLFPVAVSLSSNASQPIVLNELSLSEMSKRGSPQLDEIEAAFMSVGIKTGETREKFAPELFGKGSYSETNEKPLLSFFPVYSPIKEAQLGVRQKLNYGLNATGALTTDQRTASTPFSGKLQNLTTTVLSFTVQMDLWKDLFGRMTSAELESAQLEVKKAALEKEIQTKVFQVSLRRIYWSLVANHEATKISTALLDTAKKQVDETSRRFKSSVAEVDELARYKAQVASRQSSILFLAYQKEVLSKQLRNLLPELESKELVLGEYDLKKTMDDVLHCTDTISKEKGVPYQNTKYDDATAMLKKLKSNAAVTNSRYSDIDVKLFGTVKSTGVSSDQVRTGYTRGSFGDSIDNSQQSNRSGYEVGVMFTLPLGDAKEQTKRSKELYDEKRLNAAISGSDAQVANTHLQLMKTIKLLVEVIKSQQENSLQLEKRLKFMRKKYEQARVSVNDLINDQDALLSAELTTIDTELQILNTLFDYLVVFSDTPCSFNRI